MRVPLVLLCLGAGLASAADLAVLDVESWVVELGGSARRDLEGRVVSIDLRASWVTDLDLEKLSAAPQLRELDLSHTHITDIGLAAVGKLPNLESLNLLFCEHITEAGVAHLKDASKLERLNIRGARVSDSGMTFLTQISTLRSLDIGITQITGPSFESLEFLENLEELSIGGNRVGDLGLSYLQTLPRLRRLDLSGSQITDSGVWGVTVTDVSIELIALLSGLEELNLSASNADYIAAIGDGVPRLRNRIELTDLGVAKLSRLTQLRKLNLTRSATTPKGLEALRKLPRLEVLTVAHASKLDDSATAELLRMPKLRVLDLTGVAITDDGLRQLAEHPALKKLTVVDSAVTEAGAAEFRRLRPDCRLIW